MNKRVISIILAVACMSSVAFSGCSIADSFTYPNADKYTVGGGSIAQTITDIEVDWINGAVEIVYGEVAEVSFSETSEKTLTEAYSLHYWLEDTTLHIKCAESSNFVSAANVPKKDLKIVLPSSLALNEMEVETVGASVKVDHIKVGDVEIKTVNGEVNAYLAGTTREISVETVLGNVTIKADAVTEFDFETLESEVYFESTIAAVSGKFKSVAGTFTLPLYYQIEGFTVAMKGINGIFESNFETSKQGNEYKYGNGACYYEVETASGIVIVPKAYNYIEI